MLNSPMGCFRVVIGQYDYNPMVQNFKKEITLGKTDVKNKVQTLTGSM
jgi:hypothetical protein